MVHSDEKYDNEIHLRDILIKISDYKNMLLRKKYSILTVSVIFSIIGFLFAFTSKSLISCGTYF